MTDPILEELWRIKDDLAREAGGDLRQLCENTRRWRAEHPQPNPVVRNAEEIQRFYQPEPETSPVAP